MNIYISRSSLIVTKCQRSNMRTTIDSVFFGSRRVVIARLLAGLRRSSVEVLVVKSWEAQYVFRIRPYRTPWNATNIFWLAPGLGTQHATPLSEFVMGRNAWNTLHKRSDLCKRTYWHRAIVALYIGSSVRRWMYRSPVSRMGTSQIII